MDTCVRNKVFDDNKVTMVIEIDYKLVLLKASFVCDTSSSQCNIYF